MSLSTAEKMLVGGFVASGVTHLVRPETFEPLMPDVVPAHREVVLASGLVELLCAGGLVWPRTRRASGYVSAALLLGVWPGNLKMALDSNRSDALWWKAAAWGRMPLQVPMIRIALGAARRH